MGGQSWGSPLDWLETKAIENSNLPLNLLAQRIGVIDPELLDGCEIEAHIRFGIAETFVVQQQEDFVLQALALVQPHQVREHRRTSESIDIYLDIKRELWATNGVVIGHSN